MEESEPEPEIEVRPTMIRTIIRIRDHQES
jgi:hypothetical protein